MGKVVRERQKLRDERNSLIRKGMGKSRSNRNFSGEYGKFDDLSSVSDSTDEYSPLERGHYYHELEVHQMKKEVVKGFDGDGNPTESVVFGHEASHQDRHTQAAARGNFPTAKHARIAHESSAVAGPADQRVPVSKDQGNPYMPTEHIAKTMRPAFEKLYYNIESAGNPDEFE